MRVGILGGGQLGWMTILEGRKIGLEFLVLDSNPRSPASRIADRWFPPEDVGEFLSLADVVTAEFEHIPEDILSQASYKMKPSAEVLLMKRSRIEEKRTLLKLGYPLPRFLWGDREVLGDLVRTLGLPAVVKAERQGYDGKGQYRVGSEEDLSRIVSNHPPEERFVVEEFVSFEREVSLIGVRDDLGRVKVFPLTENYHKEGILLYNRTTHLPEVEKEAASITCSLMEDLKVVGLLAVEFFVTGNGRILINEIAPRPHNTGHYTLDGTYTSQFENLVRAICGLPLGSTHLKSPSGMVNILGMDMEDLNLSDILSVEGAKVYWYGKEKRPRRKMGHVNLVGRSEHEVRSKLDKVIDLIYSEEIKIP